MKIGYQYQSSSCLHLLTGFIGAKSSSCWSLRLLICNIESSRQCYGSYIWCYNMDYEFCYEKEATVPLPFWYVTDGTYANISN